METKTILLAILAILSVVLAGVLGYQKLNQPEITPVVVNQPPINQPVVNQPVVNRPVINQPVATTSDETAVSATICEYRKGKYEMRIYNESGQVTGMINGVVKEEIPNSIFDPESNSVIILTAEGKYTYEIYCLEEGNYQFEKSSVVNGEETVFNATNIPFYPGQTHRYQLDWDKLAEGSQGAMISVDNDKDGIFEKTFSVGDTLTCQDYLEQTKK